MLEVTIENSVATIRLNRPEIHNAFDDVLIEKLTAELNNIDQDPKIRVVILAANGKSFSAGADLNWMRKMLDYSREENLQDAFALAQLMRTLNNLSKPTIALIQGPVYGGGVGLVACCDIAIASNEASFCLSEVKIGLVPAVISPYVIAAIGARAARRYFLTAEKFSVTEALQLNLIHKIVSPEQLGTMGKEFSELLLQNSPQAVSITKQLVREVQGHSIDDVLINTTAETIANVRISAEGQEGLKAFLEKRKPKWNLV